jgi:hypothetical protein
MSKARSLPKAEHMKATALLANNRLGLKDMLGASTLAYSLVTQIKSFITVTSGAIVIRLFTVVSYKIS